MLTRILLSFLFLPLLVNAQKTMATLEALPIKEYSFPDYGVKFNFFSNAKKLQGSSDFPHIYEYVELNNDGSPMLKATYKISKKWFYSVSDQYIEKFEKEFSEFEGFKLMAVTHSENITTGALTFEGYIYEKEFRRITVVYTMKDYRVIADFIVPKNLNVDFHKKFLPIFTDKVKTFGDLKSKISLPQFMDIESCLACIGRNPQRNDRSGDYNLKHSFIDSRIMILLKDYTMRSEVEMMGADEGFKDGFLSASNLRDKLFKEFTTNKKLTNVYFFEPDKKLIPRATEFMGIAYTIPDSLSGSPDDTKGALGVIMLNESEILIDEKLNNTKIKGVKLKDAHYVAYSSGLRAGDIIQKIDQKEILKNVDVISYISTKKAGDQISVQFLRNSKTETAKIVLGRKNRSNVENYIFNVNGKIFLAEIVYQYTLENKVEKLKTPLFKALNTIE